MTYYKDLLGKRFGHLTVIALTDKRDWTSRVWLVRCDCGKTKGVRGSRLISGGCTSCGSCSKRKPYGLSSMNQRISSYKLTAKNRNTDYSLTDEEFHKITKSECFYCGSPPSNVANKPDTYGEYIYNGIDRVDSGKGYFIGNVVPCCKRCNQAKNDMSQEEFFKWIRRIYKHYKKPASIPLLF